MTTKRRALGRGLAALIPAAAPAPATPDRTIPSGTTAVVVVDGVRPGTVPGNGRAAPEPRGGLRVVGIEEVHPARAQPRKTFDDGRLDELASSIRSQGLIQPLIVRMREAGGYEIIAGERRWRAAQRAGMHTIPVVVREIAHARAFELAMVENLQREDLNPIEEAEGLDRLVREFGYTQESLAARIGKDRTTVSNALRLLKLPAGVRGLVVAGRLSMGHARAILGLESLGAPSDGAAGATGDGGDCDAAERMERMGRKAAAREMSVRQIEALVRREKADAASGGGDAIAKAPPDSTASGRDLATRLSRALGTRVRVVESGAGNGHIEIHYASLDQLDGVLAKLLHMTVGGTSRFRTELSPSSTPAPARPAAQVLELRYRSVSAFLVAYSTGLSRGEIFVETAEPLPVGARARLRLRPPGALPLEVDGAVAWRRPTAIGPGQPAGMGITLASSIEEHGAVIDELAFRHARIRILVASGETAARTVIVRYLQSILACDVVAANIDASTDPNWGVEESTLPEQIDLAIVDLDCQRQAGERLIETLKQRSATAEVPIIALAQLERDRMRAATLGVDEVLMTPPLFSELRDTVLHALSRPLPEPSGAAS